MNDVSPWWRRGLAVVVAAILLGVGIWVERQYGVPVKIVLAIAGLLVVAVLAPFEVWKRTTRRSADRRRT